MPDAEDRTRKVATAARMYDYYLGGVHNFPADVEAAKQIIAQAPGIPAAARTNRAFLRRAVRHLVTAGVRQFLDVGSGMPTVGNVHEVAQQAAPDSRVVYVDIDPVAVAESQELLRGNPHTVAVRGDLRTPTEILAHPQVRKLLDFTQPVGLLLVAVLHFVPDDDTAHRAVSTLVDALAPGSYLAISHGTTEGVAPDPAIDKALTHNQDVYQRRTATPLRLRNKADTARFFTSTELVEPGLAHAPLWRPEPDDPTDFTDNPAHSGFLVAVGRVPTR